MDDLFMERDAVLSECKRYRYLLRRAWDHNKPRALFVMLNPSTADAEVDDATIRSCIRLCKSWGYGSFEVVNLFAYRATDPRDLVRAREPVGAENEKVIYAALHRCDVVICAWGAHKMARGRGRFLVQHIRTHKPAAYCLGKTKAGEPKHPLYISSGTALEVFAP